MLNMNAIDIDNAWTVAGVVVYAEGGADQKETKKQKTFFGRTGRTGRKFLRDARAARSRIANQHLGIGLPSIGKP